jgi:hypothetical protein
LGTQDTGQSLEKTKRGNQEWTIQTLTTLGTQDTGQRLEKTKGAIKNGQSRDTGNIGYTRHRTKVRENQRGNQEWTIQTLTTLGTQDTGQRLEKIKGTIKNGQSRDTGNIGYTRNRTKVRENQRGNQEWTIQRHWQHWVHKTQDKG